MARPAGIEVLVLVHAEHIEANVSLTGDRSIYPVTFFAWEPLVAWLGAAQQTTHEPVLVTVRGVADGQ